MPKASSLLFKKVAIVVLAVLLIDQVLKIWVKTHMSLGEEIHVFGDWFIIHFTENPGMAFGMTFGGDWGKLFLSLFRVAAVIGIAFWIRNLIRKKAHPGFIIAIAFIFAGALGNILDSMFYGLLFGNSDWHVAEFLPTGGGYAGFLHGKVVDMLYFPIIEGTFPDWFPFWGGEEFLFFRPVFNIADTSISVGVGLILIGQKKYFKKDGKTKPSNEGVAEPEEATAEPEPGTPQSEPHS